MSPVLSQAPRESLLVFSDVHLGSDLNDHGTSPKRSEEIDRDLAKLLRHYADVAPAGERWRVVVAGDFIDFVGMTVRGDGRAIATRLTEEEHEHGLGSASDHAREKLRRVEARHPDVFDALAELVARGNALTLVHGNHDIELHWDEVKDDFRRILLRRACILHPSVDRASFLQRIEFEPWFFYWRGVAYIEHGHQYDPYCANDHVMAPLSPLDPRRIARGFSSILLRYVVRRTDGMKEHGHEYLGVLDYVSFGLRLGLGGIGTLVARFARAVRELFRLRRAHFSGAMTALRAEHEARMEKLAAATRVGLDRLRALAALHAAPITRSIPGIMGSVLLDRIAVGALAIGALFVVAIAALFHPAALWGALVVLALWGAAHVLLSRQRKIDPAEEMARHAGTLARLLPAAFVVMGHTHVPEQKRAGEGDATYINLGSWAEEEDDDGAGGKAYRAARTHLVIEVHDGAPRAELRAWDGDAPRPYRA